jgi:hypothetical protein
MFEIAGSTAAPAANGHEAARVNLDFVAAETPCNADAGRRKRGIGQAPGQDGALARNVAFVSTLMAAGTDFEAVDFPQANRLSMGAATPTGSNVRYVCLGGRPGHGCAGELFQRAPRLDDGSPNE